MLTHKGTKEIETPRLILRPFVMEDAPAMYRNWASDSEVTKFLTWPTHSSEAVSAMVLADWTEQYADPRYYQWAIVLRETEEPIGSIAAVNLDDSVEKAEIGYCIGRKWWHRGIMSEALKAVVDYFFEDVGMNRVEAKHDPKNPHSGGVMKKCGMTFEGTARQDGRNNQGICDLSRWAILRSEWK